MWRKLLAILCGSLAAMCFGYAGWYYVNVYSDVEVPSAPLPSEVPRITVPVDDDSASTPPAVPHPNEPRGDPTQLVVYRGSKMIVSMEFAPMVLTAEGWESQCGKVAWRSDADWPRPGAMSLNRARITGHVWCYRETYDLDNLRQVRKGDRAKVYYSSGDIVVGEAEEAAKSIPKNQLNVEKKGERNPALRNASKARTFRVTTCDTDSVRRANGHLSENVYVPYKVIEILYAEKKG